MQLQKYVVEIFVPDDMSADDLLTRIQQLAVECVEEFADDPDELPEDFMANVENDCSVQVAAD